MNWEDERYIRLYTRDTVDWNMLPFEAQALLPLILRKLDRAGVLDLGKHGLQGLRATLKAPQEFFDRGMEALLEDGCVALRGNAIVMPNFLSAQECKQSDRARKSAERERRRAEAVSGHDVTKTSESGQSVTERDTESQNVTKSHTPSHAVTDGHSVPSRAVPSRAGESAREAEPAHPPDDLRFADWTEPTAEAIALATGKKPENLRDVWVSFVVDRSKKSLRITRREWSAWLARQPQFDRKSLKPVAGNAVAEDSQRGSDGLTPSERWKRQLARKAAREAAQ